MGFPAPSLSIGNKPVWIVSFVQRICCFARDPVRRIRVRFSDSRKSYDKAFEKYAWIHCTQPADNSLDPVNLYMDSRKHRSRLPGHGPADFLPLDEKSSKLGRPQFSLANLSLLRYLFLGCVHPFHVCGRLTAAEPSTGGYATCLPQHSF